MFGSDKRAGFLTGTPGGAVTKTPKKTGPALTSTGSGPVTSLPNPVIPSPKGVAAARGKPVVAPPVAPKGVAAARGVPVRTPPVSTPTPPVAAATQVPTRARPTPAVNHIPAPKSILVGRDGRMPEMAPMSPGRGLWSRFTSQVSPGRWFSRG